MAQDNSGQMASEPLLAAWITWTMDFWDTMAQMGPGLNGAGRSGGETAASGDTWLAALNLWQAFFSLLTEPGTVTAVFQGIQAPSKIILRMAQAGWGGYFYLHQQWLESWQGGGSPSGEDGYENLDQNIFKACNEIFEQDFRRLLNLPHLCLTGLPQERVNRATERFNQFQAAMAEFIHLLYLPVKKSLRATGAEWVNAGKEKASGRFQGVLQEVAEDPGRALHDPLPVGGVYPDPDPHPPCPGRFHPGQAGIAVRGHGSPGSPHSPGNG